MAYNTKKMLEDVNGDLIPQYYDPVEDAFKPLTNDPRDVRLTGSNVQENISEEFQVIPAGVEKYVDLDVPGSATAFSLIVRADSGEITPHYAPMLGLVRWSRYNKELESRVGGTAFPAGVIFTEKEYVTSSRIRLSFAASDGGDVEMRTGATSFGAHIIWWRE